MIQASINSKRGEATKASAVGRYDDEGWNARYNALIQYGEEHGEDCNVPQGYKYTLAEEGVVKLEKWLDRQRQYKNAGKLRKDRQYKLQQLVDEGKLDWVRDNIDDEAGMLNTKLSYSIKRIMEEIAIYLLIRIII